MSDLKLLELGLTEMSSIAVICVFAANFANVNGRYDTEHNDTCIKGSYVTLSISDIQNKRYSA
jgi:hypothetical protein